MCSRVLRHAGGGAGYSLYVTADGHAVAGLLYAAGGTEVTGAPSASPSRAACSSTRLGQGGPVIVDTRYFGGRVGWVVESPILVRSDTPKRAAPAAASAAKACTWSAGCMTTRTTFPASESSASAAPLLSKSHEPPAAAWVPFPKRTLSR